MGVDRFYCPDLRIGQTAWLDGDEARHLARVRRVAVGAEVEVFDGRGLAAVAAVVLVGRDRVELMPKARLVGLPPARVELTLATAIPKGDRFDWLIEKATELGVTRVVPLITARSTVDPRSTKLDRLRRSVVEACKQSRRDTLMTLEDPVEWGRWVGRGNPSIDHRWVAHPGGSAAWTRRKLADGDQVVVAIGPEGGFAEEEVDLAQAAGWSTIALTSTILRVETAGMAAAACILIGSNRLDSATPD